MLEQGIKTNCTAKFAIAPTGKSTVELISSTGSSEVDELTLGTLRTWRFRPASLSGSPVASVRKIKVEFEVE
jgi:TonB family protein